VILTGSPAGVGFTMKPARYLVPGDTVEITVGNVGTLVHGITFALKGERRKLFSQYKEIW
jgi:2-keto-4-pentenoate hydratase/2-oxohepta-3-ene-1,7-dioic acid hydratase in catechol pathway